MFFKGCTEGVSCSCWAYNEGRQRTQAQDGNTSKSLHNSLHYRHSCKITFKKEDNLSTKAGRFYNNPEFFYKKFIILFQLSVARLTLHEIFFQLSPSEQMAYISHSRTLRQLKRLPEPQVCIYDVIAGYCSAINLHCQSTLFWAIAAESVVLLGI